MCAVCGYLAPRQHWQTATEAEISKVVPADLMRPVIVDPSVAERHRRLRIAWELFCGHGMTTRLVREVRNGQTRGAAWTALAKVTDILEEGGIDAWTLKEVSSDADEPWEEINEQLIEPLTDATEAAASSGKPAPAGPVYHFIDLVIRRFIECSTHPDDLSRSIDADRWSCDVAADLVRKDKLPLTTLLELRRTFERPLPGREMVRERVRRDFRERYLPWLVSPHSGFHYRPEGKLFWQSMFNATTLAVYEPGESVCGNFDAIESAKQFARLTQERMDHVLVPAKVEREVAKLTAEANGLPFLEKGGSKFGEWLELERYRWRMNRIPNSFGLRMFSVEGGSLDLLMGRLQGDELAHRGALLAIDAAIKRASPSLAKR